MAHRREPIVGHVVETELGFFWQHDQPRFPSGLEMNHELAQRAMGEMADEIAQLRAQAGQAETYRDAIEKAIEELGAMPLSNSYTDRLRVRLMAVLEAGKDQVGKDERSG